MEILVVFMFASIFKDSLAIFCSTVGNRRFAYADNSIVNWTIQCDDGVPRIRKGYDPGDESCSHHGRPVFRQEDPRITPIPHVTGWEFCTKPNPKSRFETLVCQLDFYCIARYELLMFLLRQNINVLFMTCTQMINSIQGTPWLYEAVLTEFQKQVCDFSAFTTAHRSDGCKSGRDRYVFYIDNTPTHCVVHTKDTKYNGQCLPIAPLWNTMVNSFNEITQRSAIDKSDSKRYNLRQKTLIYGPDYYHDPTSKTLKSFFLDAANFLSDLYPETHQIMIDNKKLIGANVFCQMALTDYAISDDKLFWAIEPTECPVSSTLYCRSATNATILNQQPFPKSIGFVWYTDLKTPTKCYVPKEMIEARSFYEQQCISFTNADCMLNKKDHTIPGGQTDRKTSYMAGLTRLYEDKPYGYWPNEWFFNQYMTRSSMPEILRHTELALGYGNEPHERTFTVKGTTMQMGVQAFCAIIVEMMPFNFQTEFNPNLERC